jgi:hypothetical protein
MDSEWRNAVAEPWRSRHDYCRRAMRQLEELDQRAGAGALSRDEVWQRAQLTSEFRDAEAAELLYREVVERFPDHSGARFALGSVMLHRGETEGIAEVERAMATDASLLLPGAQLVSDFLSLSGRHDEAATYRARTLDRHEEMAEANRERSFIGPRTTFAPSTLAPDVVSGVVSQLASHPDVTRAWLVRQVVRTMADVPAHVLALAIDGSRLSDKAQEVRGNTIAEALSLPAGVNAFVLVKAHADIRKKIAKVAGGPVYVREAVGGPARESRAWSWRS